MKREPNGSCILSFRLSKRQADDLEGFIRKTGKSQDELVGAGVYLYSGLSKHIAEGGKIEKTRGMER